jgi:phosphate uptake regulator
MELNDMEQRKIQKVGRSTLSVSLPKEWANQIGLHSGDNVFIKQCRDGTLRLLSFQHLEGAETPRKYLIDCDCVKESKLFERLIVGCYMAGIDIIKLYSTDRIAGKQIEEIRYIVQRLVGASIIETTRNEIVIQCFIDSSRMKIPSLIQRLSIITSTMLTEAITAFHDLNSELATVVIQREDEANNIYWLITRLLVSTQQSSHSAEDQELDTAFTATSFRVVSKNLERIADCSKEIAKIVLFLHESRDALKSHEFHQLSSISQLTKEIFKKAVDSFFSQDIIKANEALNLRNTLDATVETRKCKEVFPYYHAIPIMFAMITENSASIAAIAINLNINRSASFTS